MQLAGELAKMNLASLIRLVRNGELTGKVCLSQGVNTAFIYFDNGHPIHAESDSGSGRESLLELFLWQSGTFSYIESAVDEIKASLNSDEPLERLLKEGMAYQESLRYLEQLRIGPESIFRRTENKADSALLSMMDGQTPLKEIISALGMTRSEYTIELKDLIASGKALVVEAPAVQNPGLDLPDWVISRLKQDNPDISKAIIDLIIWSDRVKCWLYQADVDLQRVIGTLEGEGEEKSRQNPYEVRQDLPPPSAGSQNGEDQAHLQASRRKWIRDENDDGNHYSAQEEEDKEEEEGDDHYGEEGEQNKLPADTLSHLRPSPPQYEF